ncbi:MAG TPA: glycosyltransferase [Caldilineaceae bacterium]|nr:glycosyltransferase [Caldilineaceae bacterium]
MSTTRPPSVHRASPYRILLLIKGLGLGGAERLLVDSLPYWDRTAFEYHVAYMLPWKGLLAPAFAQAGAPVHCLGAAPSNGRPDDPAPSGVTAARSLAAAMLLPQVYRRLLALQRRYDFALIHADLPAAGLVARLAGRRLGLPVVYTEHNLQERYHPLMRLGNRLTYGWNARVLAVSDEVAASIRRNGLDRSTQVQTLLNGAPVEQVRAEAGDGQALRAALGIAPAQVVIGTVAVFRRQKRLDRWLEMAASVAQRCPSAVFVLVGDGPEMPAVREQVRALGLGERVHLTGFRADGRRYLGLMDIYVISSDYEGLPMALLEAMALGKPVVATAVGGIPEAVADGDEGLLAPPGDVPALAAQVARLVQDPSLRQAMGQAAARRVESAFHIRRRVEAIESVYCQLLAPVKVG